MKHLVYLLLGALALTTPALAQDATEADTAASPYEEGSVAVEDGLASWQLVYDVASHPRCANCHVGADNVPMWSGPSFGGTRPHGMNINAGESRIGAETLACSTCHTTLTEDDPGANALAHAAPRTAEPWMLPPAEAEWFGRSSAEVCNQLKDPERNGGRSVAEIAAHMQESALVRWGWTPGGTREPAPHSLEAAVDALQKWAAAGTPCPDQ